MSDDDIAARASEWECWVVWGHDAGPKVRAVFPTEIDALRFAVDLCDGSKVERAPAGDLMGRLA